MKINLNKIDLNELKLILRSTILINSQLGAESTKRLWLKRLPGV